MSASHVTPDGNGGWTLIGDTDPLGDVCSTAADQHTFTGQNIGDLLNAHGVTWGLVRRRLRSDRHQRQRHDRMQARADPRGGQPAQCEGRLHPASPAVPVLRVDRQSDARSSELVERHRHRASRTTARRPIPRITSTTSTISSRRCRPAISRRSRTSRRRLIRMVTPGYSDPVDEQNFIVQVMQAIQASPAWDSTAIVFAYDDSDGWYDHQAPPIVNPSTGIADALNGPGLCTTGAQQACRPHRPRRCSVRTASPRSVAAVTARACRSWSCRHTPSTTTSITRSPISPRCCVSSKTTGCAVSAFSPAARSTPSPARSTTCSVRSGHDGHGGDHNGDSMS